MLDDFPWDLLKTVIGAVIGGIAAIVGLVLAAILAVRKFRLEKAWEKKEAAYAQLFEELHSLADSWNAIYYRSLATALGPEHPSSPGLMAIASEGKNQSGRGLTFHVNVGAWNVSEETIAALTAMNEEIGTRVVESTAETGDIAEANRETVLATLRKVRQYATAELKDEHWCDFLLR